MRQRKGKISMIDLFAGMGGFSYALGGTYRTTLYCEIDKNCQKILECLMQSGAIARAPIHDDVRNLHLRSSDGAPIMLTAGSPCVDVTSLSKSATGIHGSRSKLIFEVFRLIDECTNIEAVFLENSPMIVNRGLEDVLKSFAARDFKTAWGVFTASEVGAPHLRRRWYCLATKGGELPRLQKCCAHNWTKEPVSRVVLKADCSNKNLMLRANALGNSIVPQCARYAYSVLCQALHGTLPEYHGSVSVDTIFRERRAAFQKPCQPKRRIPLSLRIEYDENVFSHKAWGTPTRNLWASICESRRATRMLATQILHDDDTLKYVQRLTGQSVSVRDMNANFTVNPVFVEWLMGYPPGWTECATK